MTTRTPGPRPRPRPKPPEQKYMMILIEDKVAHEVELFLERLKIESHSMPAPGSGKTEIDILGTKSQADMIETYANILLGTYQVMPALQKIMKKAYENRGT